MLGRVRLALALFFTKSKQKDATCMVQSHEVAEKCSLLEKEEKKGKRGGEKEEK